MCSSPQRVRLVTDLKRANSPQDEFAVADRDEQSLKPRPHQQKPAALQQSAVTLHPRGGFLFYARTTNHAPKAIKKYEIVGGLQAAFPLTHMNRHNNKHAGENQIQIKP